MQSSISAIKIPGGIYLFQSTDCPDVIPFLSKMNIFLGENNSGKSRLLRLIVANEITYKHSDVRFELLNEFIKTLKSEHDKYFTQIGINNFPDTKPIINELSYLEYINNSYDTLKKIDIFRNIIISLEKNSDRSTNDIAHKDIGKALKDIFSRHLPLIDESLTFEQDFEAQFRVPTFKKHYIPILRGMRPLASTDLYRDRTVKDYFEGNGDISFELFTGLSSYEDIKKSRLGKFHDRNLVKKYEEYLSENFFDRRDVSLIPVEGDNVLTIKIGDEKEQPIYNLGDGIQTIIVLTLPLFMNKGKNLLFFIEEPEIYLHPALQRKLLETLLTHEGFENYQYFITTHSNHFLDLTMDYDDISIYSLRKYLDEGDHDEKDAKFHIENLSHGDTSALKLLGVRNSSVFLSNCTIWVEGVTDRLYFRHYLEKYMEHLRDNSSEDYHELREDYHYSFVEYGGTNITHWSFLEEPDGEDTIDVERLCGKLFLIADKDNGEKIRHQKLTTKLEDRFYELGCIEVENLVSKKVLLKIVHDFELVDRHIDFEEEDYQNTHLGEFLDNKLGEDRTIKTYQSASGTIKYKKSFCKKAKKHIEKWDDLSEEAKKLTIKIYDFIREHNSIQ